MYSKSNRIISIFIILVMAMSFLFSFSGCATIAWQLGFADDPHETTTEAESSRPTVKVLVKPGLTLLATAELLEKKQVCSASSFIEACQAMPDNYSTLLNGVTPENKIFLLEGYIYPNTYEFYIDDDPVRVLSIFLKTMNNKMSSIINQETYGFGGKSCYERAAELDMTMAEVITLASVIQSEANLNSDMEGLAEMRKVSSVFHNRLDNPGKGFAYIGSDVTRQYIEVKMADYIKKNGLDYNALFGAYCTNNGYDLKIKGLPRGPICNPTRAAIIAALWPEKTDYYFFFTDKDHKFHYYKEYKDFQNGVREYGI